MTAPRAPRPYHGPRRPHRPRRRGVARSLAAVSTALGCLAASVMVGSPAPPPTMSVSTMSVAGEATIVDLSPSAPGAIRHPDGSWTVLVPAAARRPAPTGPVGPGAIFGQTVCSGNYVDPEIVARGRGTAVHYGIKFFCTGPVSYSIRIGVDNYYDTDPGPGGAILRHSGGPDAPTRGGVSNAPYAEGFSSPCVSNANSGWQVWDDSSLGDNQKHRDRGKRVTVGCRVP